MTYGTRRLSSTQQQETAPIAITVRASGAPSSASAAASLSSSAGKHKRPSYSLAGSRRRLSHSHAAGGERASAKGTGASAAAAPGIHISHSLPAQASITTALAARGKTFVSGSAIDDEDDGEVKSTTGMTKKEKGQLYECEKCSKVYRHSTCLIKHRWEHTAHWKEASKLLLSKHQQVQLLEAAAILNAASAGSSLPEEKSFWPAAVSPPSSGLLGSEALNIDILTSPRLNASRSLPSSAHESSDVFDDEDIEIDNDINDNTSSESVSTGDELHMAESMLFDMDIDDAGSSSSPFVSMASPPLQSSSSQAGTSRSSDSGYGSFKPGSAIPTARPVLGFFEGSLQLGAIV